MRSTIVRQTLDGWMERCLNLDAQRPGFLRHVLTAIPAKRHAAFLILAHRESASGGDQPIGGALLDRLMSDKPGALIEAEFGHVPESLIGTLNRLEEDLPPTLYRKLFDQFREKSERAKALQQVSGTLRRATIRIALYVHPVGVHPTAIIALEGEARTVSTATFAIMIKQIQAVCSTATDEVLRESLISSACPVEHWLAGWLRKKVDTPPFDHCIRSDDPVFERLTGPTCQTWGQKLRNCLGSRAGLTAMGLTAYAVSRTEPTIALEFRRLSTGLWLLTEMAGQDNIEPSLDETQPLLNHLDGLGILRVWEPEEHLRIAAERVLRTPIGMVRRFDPYQM